jgi:glycosyltransferase involved in cell wall biosynthesis
MVHANILARLTRLICPVPALICTAQNVYEVSTTTERPGKYSVRDLLYCITDPLAEVTTQVCKAGAERYVRIRATSARRMRLIHNAVDLSGFDPTTELRATVRRELGLEYAWVWLAVGRLEPQKDLSTLLKAFQRIHELRPESALLIVGEGRLRPALEREISDLGLDKAVCLLGMRADVSSLMAGADAYVMSSVYEGLPLVLVEAAASRLPIVATDVGGNPDVVIDGETGLLVPAGSPDSLGKAMTRLMMMPDSERRCMVEKSRARVEARFEMTRIVDQWEELYREVLERKGLGNRSTMPRALAAPIRTVGQSGCT